MGTYSKAQQRELDQRPVEKPVVWAMGDREIVDTFNTKAEWDEDSTISQLIQMTADSCSVSYARVLDALRNTSKEYHFAAAGKMIDGEGD